MMLWVMSVDIVVLFLGWKAAPRSLVFVRSGVSARALISTTTRFRARSSLVSALSNMKLLRDLQFHGHSVENQWSGVLLTIA